MTTSAYPEGAGSVTIDLLQSSGEMVNSLYTDRSVIELTATAAHGHHFVGWEGDGGSEVTMDGNKVVIAVFEKDDDDDDDDGDEDEPPPLPDPPGDDQDSKSIDPVTSVSPEDKWGPAGYDAPEVSEPEGQAAKDKLSKLVLGRYVELRPPYEVDHGQLICTVFFPGVKLIDYFPEYRSK